MRILGISAFYHDSAAALVIGGDIVAAALAVWHTELGKPRTAGTDRMNGAFLGPWFTDPDISKRLAAAGARFELMTEQAANARAADALATGKAVGWFQGRMEFGPRASAIARSSAMRAHPRCRSS